MELADTSTPFLCRHRWGVVLAVLASFFAGVWGLLWLGSGSLLGSSLVAIALGAASLVLALPAAVALVCAAEWAETRWRARRDPVWAAWLGRQRAAEHDVRRRVEAELAHPQRRPIWWRGLRHDELCRRVAALHESGGWTARAAPSRAATGVDLVVCRQGRIRVVRCEAGPDPARLAVGRELVAARLDLEADEAVLVAPCGLEGGLLAYLRERDLQAWDADEVAERASRMG